VAMTPCHAEATRQMCPVRAVAAASQRPQAHSGGWASSLATFRLTSSAVIGLRVFAHVFGSWVVLTLANMSVIDPRADTAL
jgi:hypothetical protein